jgi:hypothetical protein
MGMVLTRFFLINLWPFFPLCSIQYPLPPPLPHYACPFCPMNGPKCGGCGIRFPYATVATFLDGGECPACMASVDPNVPRPRQCKGCAVIYGQLSTEYCSDCKIACASEFVAIQPTLSLTLALHDILAEAERMPNKRNLSPEKQELLRDVDRSLANRPNPHIRVRPTSSGSGWDVVCSS